MSINMFAAKAIYLKMEAMIGFWNGNYAPTQFSDPVNFTKISTTPPPQETERLISNMASDYGNVIDSQVKVTGPAVIEVDFNTLSPQLLGLAMGASVSEDSQTVATVSDEAVTTVLNAWVRLESENIADHGSGTEIVLKKSSVTVSGDKYELNTVLGMIKAVHSDAVGNCSISYHKAARQMEVYSGGQAKSNYVMFRGRAYEMKSGLVGILTVHKCRLFPAGNFDFAAGGYLSGSLKGDMITPPDCASPWEWQLTVA